MDIKTIRGRATLSFPDTTQFGVDPGKVVVVDETGKPVGRVVGAEIVNGKMMVTVELNESGDDLFGSRAFGKAVAEGLKRE